MATVELITAIVSSSVIASLLTSFFNFKLQMFNYKIEYYKKIIERRMAAFEQVERISNELRILVKIEDGKLCTRLCATGEEHFNSVLIMVVKSADLSIWLSENLSNVLFNLNLFLVEEISSEIKGENKMERDQSLIDLGVKNHERIRNFRKKIEQQLIKDLADLTDVEGFLKKMRNYDDKIVSLKK